MLIAVAVMSSQSWSLPSELIAILPSPDVGVVGAGVGVGVGVGVGDTPIAAAN